MIFIKFLKEKLEKMWSIVRGDTHMTSTLKEDVCVCLCVGEGGGGCAGVRDKNEMLSDVGGGGLAILLDVQSLFFLLKKIRFAPWSDIMLIIYYCQEIFLLILTPGSEDILWLPQWFFEKCIFKRNGETLIFCNF